MRKLSPIMPNVWASQLQLLCLHKHPLPKWRARVLWCECCPGGRNLNECEGTVNKLIDDHALTLIHPYDDEFVMMGQGTAGLEMLSDTPDIDILVVPIGGGGLIGGIATIARDMRPNIKIYGSNRALPNDETCCCRRNHSLRR